MVAGWEGGGTGTVGSTGSRGAGGYLLFLLVVIVIRASVKEGLILGMMVGVRVQNRWVRIERPEEGVFEVEAGGADSDSGSGWWLRSVFVLAAIGFG